MPVSLTLAVIFALTAIGFLSGLRRAWSIGQGSRRDLHSLPVYHGWWVALCTLLPAVILILMAVIIKYPLIDALVWADLPDSYTEGRNRAVTLSRIDAVAAGIETRQAVTAEEQAAADRMLGLHNLFDWIMGLAAIGLSLLLGVYANARIHKDFRARNSSERIFLGLLVACSVVAILTTIGIVFSLATEALLFFSVVTPQDFFFGLDWSPQNAIREDQNVAEGAFGFVPLFTGSLIIAGIAMLVAAPVGLLSAIYMVEFAHPNIRATAKPVIEILAGVPTVVYGFFAAVTVAPIIKTFGESMGLTVSSESALAAGMVMGIMIIPFVSSLSDDVISSVPYRLRDAALSLGATEGETILKVVLPAALPGLLSAMVLAISRALGETMIVVMAAGLAANLTANPLESVTTITVQITTVLTGDQPFDSPTTLSAFALGLALFLVTLVLNIIGLRVMEVYQERYD